MSPSDNSWLLCTLPTDSGTAAIVLSPRGGQHDPPVLWALARGCDWFTDGYATGWPARLWSECAAAQLDRDRRIGMAGKRPQRRRAVGAQRADEPVMLCRDHRCERQPQRQLQNEQ